MPKDAVDTASLAEERALRDTQRMREVAKKKDISSYVWRETEAERAEKPLVEKSAKKVRFSNEEGSASSPVPSPYPKNDPPSPAIYIIAAFALGAVMGGIAGVATTRKEKT